MACGAWEEQAFLDDFALSVSVSPMPIARSSLKWWRAVEFQAVTLVGALPAAWDGGVPLLHLLLQTHQSLLFPVLTGRHSPGLGPSRLRGTPSSDQSWCESGAGWRRPTAAVMRLT